MLADALERALAAQGRFHDQSRGIVEDLSELWQYRLNQPADGIEQPRSALVRALVRACDDGFVVSPNRAAEMDQDLRQRPWTVFQRIRQHLYASHLTEQTKPWIREMILDHDGYGTRSFQYDFQLLVRLACEHFGSSLLDDDEIERIFHAITDGPVRRHDHGSDDEFRQLQSIFHRKQLRPFSAVLCGRHRDYFQQLDQGNEYTLTDDDYFGLMRHGQMREIASRSHKSQEQLTKLTDEDLLLYINGWEDEHELPGDAITQINFEALAKEFGQVFSSSISLDEARHRFWIDNVTRIERPIYVRAMVDSAKTLLENAAPERLADWLAMCDWVLTHPDEPWEQSPWYFDTSKEKPYWGEARRAVGDFIDACARSDAPAVAQCTHQIADVLRALCTQYDWQLDGDVPVYGGRGRWMDEAVNSARSMALRRLIVFAMRLKQSHSEVDLSPVMGILTERVESAKHRPITRPELAMLGLHFNSLHFLDERWAIAHKATLFPADDARDWLASFGTFLEGNFAHKQTYEIFADDYEIAVENLPDLVGQGQTHTAVIDAIGQHVLMFTFGV